MVQKSCRTLDKGKWIGSGRLIVARVFASGVRLPDRGWWVTGGEDDHGDLLDSSEIVVSESTTELEVEPGPLLPVKISQHCLVRIDNTKVMLIGGRTENEPFSAEAFYFNWQKSKTSRRRTWSTRMSMRRGRRGHTCFVIDDTVFVAGGDVTDDSRGSDSVEVFDLQNLEWNVITALPLDVQAASVFHWNSRPTLVGGTLQGDILRWDDEDDEWIIDEEKTISESVSYAIALEIKMSWVCS